MFGFPLGPPRLGMASVLTRHYWATALKYLHTVCIRIALHQRKRTCGGSPQVIILIEVPEAGLEPARPCGHWILRMPHW